MAKERDVVAEATGPEGTLDAVTLMNILSPRGKGERRAEAVQAAAPKRQQTLDDFLFAKSPKETNREALIKLSAQEIDDMLGAMDRGPGVDVREGPNKEAFDIMRMKRGLEAGGTVDETGALSFDYSEPPERLSRSEYGGYSGILGRRGRAWEGWTGMTGSHMADTIRLFMDRREHAREEEPDVGTLW